MTLIANLHFDNFLALRGTRVSPSVINEGRNVRNEYYCYSNIINRVIFLDIFSL